MWGATATAREAHSSTLRMQYKLRWYKLCSAELH